ncbi:MAG TPA: ABC transporter permease subunit [Anaeromyxobacteraceae bacterium]|nr:ABC transporter permease subunit [Anaeromyxobacteraceae bacterium]
MRARRPRPLWLRPATWGLALVLAAAWRGAEGNLSALAGPEARRAALDLARGFWPPAHSAEFLARAARPLAETVAIAVLGMTLALLLASPLALAATSPAVHASCGRSPGLARRGLHAAARALLDLLRAVPELVWALLFVRAVGIGPAPGVLAIGVSYAGVLGKVFAEILESAPRAPAEALAASGATPAAALALGIGPAARPVLASYTLYRFDCALRSSAVLGVVGAGGVGQEIELSLKMLAYDEVAAWVIALFALVAAVDVASGRARRWMRSAPLFPAGRREAVRWAAAAAGALVALAVSLRVLGLSAASLLSPGVLVRLADYGRGFFPPEVSGRLLRSLAPAAAETLAVSVLGTALAAAGGILLAWGAAQRVRALATGREGPVRRGMRRAVTVLSRATLALGRTLPELLWALLFTFAVGLGPFAGALALGVHTAGVLGRLYAEALEEVPEAAALALRAAGASPLAAGVLAVVPQAWPQLVAYTLYRWEVNIRASAVLGVVGAGGLGRDLYVALSLFDYHRAATLVLAILVLVFAVDAASGLIRSRLVAGGTAPDRAAEAPAVDAEAPVARAW